MMVQFSIVEGQLEFEKDKTYVFYRNDWFAEKLSPGLGEAIP